MGRKGALLGAALMVLLLVLPATQTQTIVAQPELVPHRLRVPLTDGTREVTIWLEPGFEIGVAASGVKNARMLAQSPSGDLVLSQHMEGKVVRLSDPDGDGFFDRVEPIMTGLSIPHGLAFIGERLFIAENDRVRRLDVWWDDRTAHTIAPLPSSGLHLTRSLTAGPDGKLYVSIGSSCDACEEGDPMRAAIWRLDPDTGSFEPYARGIRNAVGLTWSPDGAHLWATENERNELGEEMPPDEIIAVRPDADYGWPGCYGDRLPAPGFGSPERCAGTDGPTIPLPAHIAPLGLVFYTADRFPEQYRGDLFVAFHGSAVRENAVGYELARIPMQNGVPQPPRTFARGWLVNDDSWGRPVGPYVTADGTLYLTDDKGGVVYRIRPSEDARRP